MERDEVATLPTYFVWLTWRFTWPRSAAKSGAGGRASAESPGDAEHGTAYDGASDACCDAGLERVPWPYGKEPESESENRCDRLLVVSVMGVTLNDRNLNVEGRRRRGLAFDDVGLHYLVVKCLAVLVPKCP